MTPFAAALRSEWTKLISLRSTKVALALAIVLGLALTALLAVVAGATHDDWKPQDLRSWDPVGASVIGGLVVAIVMTVLAVTSATGEYVSGTIRLTFTATPRRGRVLAAKTLVMTAMTLVVGLLSNVSMFFLGQALFGAYGIETASLLESDSLRLVLLGGLLTPVLPVVALLIGMMLRSSAAAITGIFAFVFGLPILGGLLPSWWQDHVFDFMLFEAADAITNADAPISPGIGLLVTTAWMAALVAATWALLERRDA